jgi:integrase
MAILEAVVAARTESNTRRGYGTGSLRVVGRSWIGSWYGADGRKLRRKVGPARTPGERDGLSKSQAEERFRKMRGAEQPSTRTDRVTMAEAGQELCRRLEIRGRKKSHRLTVESDLRNHIAPFFAGKELGKIEPRDIERYIAAKLKTLAPKTVRNHLNTMHSVFEIGQRMG